MELLAQPCLDRGDISLGGANYKEIVNEDRDVCAFAVMEYTVVGCEGFETKGFEVGRKSKIPDTR